jgi:hypothetical protein
MNADYKSQWIAALRSGKYKQGKHHLRPSSNTFCSLGVLCDLVDPSKWEKRRGRFFTYGNELDTLYDMFEKIDFSYPNLNELFLMNDKKGKSFKQIANWIDKHL